MRITHDKIRVALEFIADEAERMRAGDAIIKMIGDDLGGERGAAYCWGEPSYAGSPCKHLHDGTRYTLTGHCVACLKGKWNSPRFQDGRRESALKRHKVTYIADETCKKCGTKRKYTLMANCVRCHKENHKMSMAKRDARRLATTEKSSVVGQ